MKKVIVVILTIVSFGIEVNAQKSFYEGLSEVEGVKYERRDGLYNIEGKEGYHRLAMPYEKDAVGTFELLKLPSNSPYGFSFVAEGGKRIAYQTQLDVDYIVDHHSYPSHHRYKLERNVYIFVDSMFIQLGGISSDGLSYKTIKKVFVPYEEVNEDQPKKKLSIKEKLAAAKDVLKNGSDKSRWGKKVREMNLDELVTNYLKEMKAKQAACNPSLEKKMADEIAQAKNLELADIDAYNDSLYNTPEYQRIRENKARIARAEGGSKGDRTTYDSFKVVNNSGETVHIGSSAHDQISAGSSKNFNCAHDVYYYTLEGNTWKRGALFAKGSDACDSVISID